MDETASQRVARGRAIFERINPTGGDAVLNQLSDVAPDLADLVQGFVYGDIYDRSKLPLRERQLIRLAVLAAVDTGPTALRANVGAALNIGIPSDHIAEVFIQCLPYVGFPRVIDALQITQQLLTATVLRDAGPSQ